MDQRKLTAKGLARLRGGRWTAEEAQRVLASQSASGETLTGFARRHGLHRQRLLWWRSRLQEWRADEGAGRAMLVPAVVPAAPDPGRPPQVSLRLGAEVQIEVADTSVVRPQWLAELVQALGARQ